MIDPPTSREWKRRASRLMLTARGRSGLLRGPLSVTIEAVFARPRSERIGIRSWCDRCVGDGDNIAKAALDAANGILWRDDSQVAQLVVLRLVGARGESAHVRMTVATLSGDVP